MPDSPPRPRGAYLPFGAGRRVCIGSTFALAEATLITAAISASYEFELSGDAEVVPQATVTLRPTGLRMRLRRVAPSRTFTAWTAVLDD